MTASEPISADVARPQARGGETAAKGIARGAAAAGSIVAAILASSCCVVPFALFSLGVTGAWIGRLTSFAPYQPYAIAVALVLLASGFVLVYRRPGAGCAEGSYCAQRSSRRAAKASLWVATALIAIALIFPYAVALIFPE